MEHSWARTHKRKGTSNN